MLYVCCDLRALCALALWEFYLFSFVANHQLARRELDRKACRLWPIEAARLNDYDGGRDTAGSDCSSCLEIWFLQFYVCFLLFHFPLDVFRRRRPTDCHEFSPFHCSSRISFGAPGLVLLVASLTFCQWLAPEVIRNERYSEKVRVDVYVCWRNEYPLL